MARSRWWSSKIVPGKHQESGAHSFLNGENWRQALLILIGQLLVFKLIALVGMKLFFFSGSDGSVVPSAVEAKLFPAEDVSSVMEKPHG